MRLFVAHGFIYDEVTCWTGLVFSLLSTPEPELASLLKGTTECRVQALVSAVLST